MLKKRRVSGESVSFAISYSGKHQSETFSVYRRCRDLSLYNTNGSNIAYRVTSRHVFLNTIWLVLMGMLFMRNESLVASFIIIDT